MPLHRGRWSAGKRSPDAAGAWREGGRVAVADAPRSSASGSSLNQSGTSAWHHAVNTSFISENYEVGLPVFSPHLR